MKISAIRIFAAALAVAALGFTSACSSDSGEDGSKSKDSTSKESSAAPEKEEDAPAALSEAELEKMVLATGDVEGYKVTEPEEDEDAGKEQAVEPECAPIGAVIGGLPQPEPSAIVYKGISPEKNDGTLLFEMLSTHEEAGAAKVVTDLKKAVKDCAGGFSTKGSDGDPTKYTSVEELEEPAGGDSAVAFKAIGEIESEGFPLTFSVIQKGGTVAFFYALNIPEPDKAEVPAELITAQLEKIK